MKTCIARDCQGVSVGRGLCGKHWQRWRKRGTFDLPTPMGRLSKYIRRTETCWLWAGALDRHGYGATFYDGRVQRAHRAVYMELVGEIPQGLVLDHLCRTPACVRPDHLEPVTDAENLRRGLDPNRAKKAQTHCKHGHPFEGRNLIIESNGCRRCRTCLNAAQQRSKAKKKVSA